MVVGNVQASHKISILTERDPLLPKWSSSLTLLVHLWFLCQLIWKSCTNWVSFPFILWKTWVFEPVLINNLFSFKGAVLLAVKPWLNFAAKLGRFVQLSWRILEDGKWELDSLYPIRDMLFMKRLCRRFRDMLAARMLSLARGWKSIL